LKRLLDILLSVCGLLALSPVALIVGVGVAIDMGRPILFRQERPGSGERSFTVLKFRSMHDHMVTRFGAFLRRSSLDELPQLVNVLVGDMSIVGPRPLLTRYLPYYSHRERLRHSVRPGITGWAQIHGRNTLSWDRRLEMDVWYVENRTFLLDLRIMLRTFGAVLSRRGVIPNPDNVDLPDLDVERQELTS
jgi:sugar transferase EpsL